MRDERYRAVHRGGPLDLERHRLLATWATACVEHVLHLFTESYSEDDRPLKALEAARAWSKGEITVGEARNAALKAHAAAREVAGAARSIARASGHAAATAHMADHAPRAASYAVKAVEAAAEQRNDTTKDAAAKERAWQKEQLPEEIRELLLATFSAT